MTQPETSAKARAGDNPIQVLIQMNRQTGQVVVTGPVELPGIMLEMLARAVGQVARIVELKRPEVGSEGNGKAAAKPDLSVVRNRIILPGR